MKYKIGTIARMLGVSIETVRNFERMGLIHPERNEQTDYRLFNAVDVNILRRARSYTGYHGVSMKQSTDLITGGSVGELADALGDSARQLNAQIQREMQLLMFTREKQHRLHRISAAENDYFIENSPAMYGFVYRHGVDFTDSPEVEQLFHAWNALRPFTEASVHYSLSDFDQVHYSLAHGLLIEEEYARFFGVTDNALVQFFPSRKCLFTFTSVPIEPEVTVETTFRFAFGRALAARGLTMTGDPYGRVVHTSKCSGEYRHYLEVWVPID